MKRLAAGVLLVCLGWGIAMPVAAHADTNFARTAAQKKNRKQSRKDVRQMKKARKKMRKKHK